MTTTLNQLLPGTPATIASIEKSNPYRKELLALGLTPGTLINLIRFAPLGDPIQVCVRGVHLSLRKKAASAITVIT